jgi:hypothetical protein
MRMKLAVAALVALGVGGCYIALTDDGPVIGVAVRPIYAPIAGTGIRVVTNAGTDVFYYGGTYYRYRSGRWWRSPTWTSGWAPIAIVPRVFLSIPRTHRCYNVVRHHPLHKVRPTHPANAVRPVAPARPTHIPPGRSKVRNTVHDAAKKKVDYRPVTPARPAPAKKEKKPKKGGR